MQRTRIQHLLVAVLLILLCSAAAAPSQQQALSLDPAQTQVQYTVDSTLHTVHGTFKLKSGSLQFDPAGGPATGQIVVDASSGNSGNNSRDHKMSKEVLEADKYQEITFTAQQMKGALASSGESQIQLEGTISLHGQSHPLMLDVKANVQGNSLSAETAMVIPYIQWGLKNPGNFLLHMSDKVNIHIHAVGTLKAPGNRP